jgi:hypothetical protein
MHLLQRMSPSGSYSPMFVFIPFRYFLEVLVCHFYFKFRSVILKGIVSIFCMSYKAQNFDGGKPAIEP